MSAVPDPVPAGRDPSPPRARPGGGRLACTLVALATVLPAASAQQFPPTPVRVAPVQLETVQERRTVVGDVRAVHRSAVAAEEPGIVRELAVRVGDRPGEGDVLARLDDSRLQLELSASLAQQAADQAQLEQRRAELEQAARDAQTLRELAGRAAANPKELADAETAEAVARSRLAQAEQALLLTGARLRLLERRLDDLVVRAPYSGLVVQRHADPGEWLAEGAPVVELVSAELEAWIDVPQQVLGQLGGADQPTVRIDATGQELPLVDPRIVPDVDPRGRSFRLVARLPHAAGHVLAPGMSLTATVPTGERRERLTLPVDAILRNEAGTYVYAALGGGPESPPVATPIMVDVAFVSQGRAVLRDARLEPGTLVVVEGNERLSPMAPLQPIEQATPHQGTNGDDLR